MTLSVQGKTAIVTGGGSGINLSFVRLLLSKGCSVVIADLALRPEAESLLTTTTSPSCHFHRTNVSSWPNLQTLWDFSQKVFPQGIDIVVAGAGVFEPRSSAFWEAPRTATNPDTASQDDAEGEPGHYMQLDVNLASPIRLAQMAIGHWTQRKQKGCLIFVGSIAGYNATVASPLYHASKFGLLGFARSLGELKEAAGIRVSYMAPAQVKTPMWVEDAHKASLITPDTEFVEPEEIADAMLDLVVDEKLGDGTVYEVTKGKRRVVPVYNNPPPTGYGLKGPGYMVENAKVLSALKHGSFKI